jgi:hypothetical protein
MILQCRIALFYGIIPGVYEGPMFTGLSADAHAIRS